MTYSRYGYIPIVQGCRIKFDEDFVLSNRGNWYALVEKQPLKAFGSFDGPFFVISGNRHNGEWGVFDNDMFEKGKSKI